MPLDTATSAATLILTSRAAHYPRFRRAPEGARREPFSVIHSAQQIAISPCPEKFQGNALSCRRLNLNPPMLYKKLTSKLIDGSPVKGALFFMGCSGELVARIERFDKTPRWRLRA
jgi:hypothetical protein